MLLQIHPTDPQPRLIKQVAESLKDGGVVIYPTDTIYGLGCDIMQHKAVERICKIKNIDPFYFVTRSAQQNFASLSYNSFYNIQLYSQ